MTRLDREVVEATFSALRLENTRLESVNADLLEALEGAIGALEQDLEAGRDSADADWEGLAYQRLEAARAAIAKARGESPPPSITKGEG